MKRRRVVVTGMGAFSPLGLSVEESWAGLVAGRSGIGPMTLCDPSDFPCQIAGRLRGSTRRSTYREGSIDEWRDFRSWRCRRRYRQ